MKKEKISYEARMNIVPTKDFEPGMNFTFNISAGKDGKAIFDLLPDYFHESPITYSFEFTVKEPDQASIMIEKLEGVKQMLLGLVPNIQQVQQMICVDNQLHATVSQCFLITISSQGPRMNNATHIYGKR